MAAATTTQTLLRHAFGAIGLATVDRRGPRGLPRNTASTCESAWLREGGTPQIMLCLKACVAARSLNQTRSKEMIRIQLVDIRHLTAHRS
jgi:hypothetical protein